ncbi:hypothetical protein NDS46_30065 (plasmid) [Paenibacillus thiaminolyticus]|uniref:hypothetical protein n=1 Tax=Paenibacillus thiaminolyticus TaxID=49283 RepID=UPI00232F109D|nr:hypothetical protein [Paenibacillus thiaminolyticus]WCF11593.1 hypothetical protein NDS46_30065 [Paenibacillus thiaminolyticus]
MGEKENLLDLSSELKKQKGKMVLFSVIDDKRIEPVADSVYFDPNSSLSFESIKDLKRFIASNQRWAFERFLGEEYDLSSFSWEEIDQHDLFDEHFEKFALSRLGLYKSYSRGHQLHIEWWNQ